MGLSLARVLLTVQQAPQQQLLVYDDGKQGASDHASAIINPWNLRNGNQAIDAPTMDYLVKWYGDFLKPWPLIHLYTSPENKASLALKNIGEPYSLDVGGAWYASHGACRYTPAYKVDWKAFRANIHASLGTQILHKALDPTTALRDKTEGSTIIWCTGYDPERSGEADAWPEHTWKPAVGEYLILDLDEAPPEPLHSTFFLEPIEGGLWRWGSTYRWTPSSPNPSRDGLDTLTDALKAIYREKYTIVDHRACVRPILAQRRPTILKHRTKPGQYFIAGLGARGFAEAPLLARQAAAILLS